MRRVLRWSLVGMSVALAASVALVLVLHRWAGSDDFRARVEREASAALGAPLALGRLSVDLWPVPAVAADAVRIATQPALTIERVEARPGWAALLAGRLEIATLVVRRAVLPQAALAALGGKPGPAKPVPTAAPAADAGATLALLPRRALLDDVTWIDAQGRSMTVDATLRMDEADGAVEFAELRVVQGRFLGSQATLERRPQGWPIRVQLGGGQVAGLLRLQQGSAGLRRLSGEFTTENVEVSALTAPSRTLTGRLQATTSLQAEFRSLDALADALRSDTRFTVRDAVLHGIDLAKAVQTIGRSRGGETRFDTLAGRVATQGKAVQLSNLVAASGVLSATGNVSVAANRRLDGRVAVDLARSGGAIAVPLQVGGTADAPSVTLSRSALVGAAIGGAVAAPDAGAKLGGRLGEGLRGLFGR